MVNKPLIRPYFLGGSFGGVVGIPMMLHMMFYKSGGCTTQGCSLRTWFGYHGAPPQTSETHQQVNVFFKETTGF